MVSKLEDIYEEKRLIYKRFTNKLKRLINELLGELREKNKVFLIESRTKSIESFVKKSQSKKNYQNLEEITDLAGIRIIAYYKEDVDRIGEVIKKEFEIDKENSIDKTQILDPDRFGYLSVHYVISLNPDRKNLSDWKDFADMKAEIQIRTALQHAWAVIDHKLRYKTEREIPKKLKRRLFRLSALLELADEEFSNLKELTENIVKQYAKKVSTENLSDMELNLSSLQVYIESKKPHLEWMKVAEEVGFKEALMPKEESSWLLKILDLTGIKNIEELDKFLKNASTWGRAVLANIYEKSVERGHTPIAFPYEVISLLALYAYVTKEKKNLDEKILSQTGYRNELQEAIKQVCIPQTVKEKEEG